MKTMLKHHSTAVVLAVLGVAMLFMPLMSSQFFLFFATDALIAALLAVSLNLLVGYGGLVSFGHAAYFGVGAYTCAILMKTQGWPFSAAVVAAAGMAALVGLVAGYFCVQLSKVYFSMLTLAFSQIVWAICVRWNDLTGGDQGMTGIPYPDFTLLKSLPGMADVSDSNFFYYVVLLLVSLCVGFTFLLVKSRFGRCLMATRENPQRCVFIGLDVRKIHLTAFCISSALAGVAGALFGVFNRGVFPDFVDHSQGAEVLIMVLLGGSGTFWGPAIGAALMLWLHQEASAITDYWGAILGIILALLTLLLPGGIAGAFESLKRKMGWGGNP